MIPLILTRVWSGDAQLGLFSAGPSESPNTIWPHRRRRSSTTDSDRDSMKPAISPSSTFSSALSLRTTIAHCLVQVARRVSIDRTVDALVPIGEAAAVVGGDLTRCLSPPTRGYMGCLTSTVRDHIYLHISLRSTRPGSQHTYRDYIVSRAPSRPLSGARMRAHPRPRNSAS